MKVYNEHDIFRLKDKSREIKMLKSILESLAALIYSYVII